MERSVLMYPVEYNSYAGGLARGTTRLHYGSPNGVKEYRIADHLGSTRVVVSGTGAVVGDWDCGASQGAVVANPRGK